MQIDFWDSDKWINKADNETIGIWIKILSLAGINHRKGFIGIADNLGYTDEQLQSLLGVKNNEWQGYFIDKKALKRGKNNVFEVINWGQYQSEYERQKPYRISKNIKKHEKVTDKVTNESYKQSYPVEVEVDLEVEVEKNKDINTSYEAKSPELLKSMISIAKDEFNKVVVVDWASDGKIIKNLKYLGEEILLKAWRKFLSGNEWADRVGRYDIKIFKNQINTCLQEVMSKSEKWLHENESKWKGYVPKGCNAYAFNPDWFFGVLQSAPDGKEYEHIADAIKYQGAKNLKGCK